MRVAPGRQRAHDYRSERVAGEHSEVKRRFQVGNEAEQGEEKEDYNEK